MKVNWLQSADRQSLEDNSKQVKFYTGLLSLPVLLAIYLKAIFLAMPCLISSIRLQDTERLSNKNFIT